ncbi:hypothetical protein F8M41_001689 [Gigaspora margarita]|uniref:Uncharacterized protein n=1 Tax=Gigaspora margarita TaxID=4874 RepID=A0A8H4A8U9_GIGMA|nr:hypothetical protein F8M41_001689 [Gigaspora margarita]
MCKIAVSQSYHDWNSNCSCWMQQQYAKLWTCQVAGKYIAVAGQVGVYYEKWNFSTLDFYIGAPTACMGPGLGNYQVNIPTQEVFWDLPIVRGVSIIVGYVIAVPVLLLLLILL